MGLLEPREDVDDALLLFVVSGHRQRLPLAVHGPPACGPSRRARGCSGPPRSPPSSRGRADPPPLTRLLCARIEHQRLGPERRVVLLDRQRLVGPLRRVVHRDVVGEARPDQSLEVRTPLRPSSARSLSKMPSRSKAGRREPEGRLLRARCEIRSGASDSTNRRASRLT